MLPTIFGNITISFNFHYFHNWLVGWSEWGISSFL